MLLVVANATVGVELWDSIVNMPVLAIILFALGITLLVAEMFVPNFGIMGGIGLVSLFVAVILTARSFTEGLILAVIILAGAGIFLTLVLRSAFKGKLSKRLILRDSTDTSSGFEATPNFDALLGRAGTALTVLRPSGTALIGGTRVDVVTDGEFIPEGRSLTVVQVVGNRVVVRKADAVSNAAGGSAPVASSKNEL